MKNRFGIGLFFVLLLSFFAGVFAYPPIVKLPDFQYIGNFGNRQKAFIDYMLPKIETSNLQIMASRQRIILLTRQYQKHHKIAPTDQEWLEEIAEEYQVPPIQFNKNFDTTELLKRVDIIPPSLVLAQTINESAWGTSRFAREANNLFGQWCFTDGCGVVPMQRPTGAIYEVAKFPTVLASVDAYMYNLNTNMVFEPLREIRASMRSQSKILTGLSLAPGLINYSAIGENYVETISDIINNYDLAQYDQDDDQ
jgi:Bax protein